MRISLSSCQLPHVPCPVWGPRLLFVYRTCFKRAFPSQVQAGQTYCGAPNLFSFLSTLGSRTLPQKDLVKGHDPGASCCVCSGPRGATKTKTARRKRRRFRFTWNPKHSLIKVAHKGSSKEGTGPLILGISANLLFLENAWIHQKTKTPGHLFTKPTHTHTNTETPGGSSNLFRRWLFQTLTSAGIGTWRLRAAYS